ncbi:MAG: hydroxymethylbilane synthase, partial [Bacteroidota bacterium]
MKKLEESDWAGMLLARAGIVRLGWDQLIGEVLDPETILPAVGQGALGIEIREGDKRSAGYVSALHHTPTAIATLAERALLRRLEGGCQVPIGTLGRTRNGRLLLDAMVGSIDGRVIVRGKIDGPFVEAEMLGKKLAEQLLTDGAEEILRQIRGASTETETEAIDV